MNTLQVDFENCYGINKLKHTFKFSESKVQLIYAANGMMKSSFANIFEDIANRKISMDRIFGDRQTKRIVILNENEELLPENIFVIQRFKEPSFQEASTLLANNEIRERYNRLNEVLSSSKDEFIKLIQPYFGIRRNLIEDEIKKVFNNELFENLNYFNEEIEKNENNEFYNISYTEVFNDKVLNFLNSKDFNKKIKEYIEIYESIVNNNDTLFVKGTFNHYNANTISKSLKDNKFFDANHKVIIKEQEIRNAADLENLIIQERDKVLKDPELKNKFDEIDKALNNNVELRKFRSFIEENNFILNELKDVSAFRRKIILSYFIKEKEAFHILLATYSESEADRKTIIEEAKRQQADWENVLSVFKDRFSVPFELLVGNQDDVILNDKAPVLIFRYRDFEGFKDLGGTELQQSLSTGENRVFYLLDIIFQFEVRRKKLNKQLVIVDDIADSFDYRNKYAIIQYLKDISEENDFYMIVLTHNFDFYRTFKSRLGDKINFQGNWMGMKGATQTVLKIGEKRDVFPQLKKKYGTCELSFIACIPFVRNLIEFTVGETDDNYLLLTSLLHLKPERVDKNIPASKDIDKKTVNDIFNIIFRLNTACDNPNKKVIDLIQEEASNLIADPELDFTDLKIKLCLSMAIRLRAEEFMISKIRDATFHNNIHKKQTGKIVNQYRSEYPLEKKIHGILDGVLLMTAENIHVNSFMYEPLMDISIEHLKKLYHEVFELEIAHASIS